MKQINIKEQHPAARAAIDRWTALKSLRVPHENDWRSIASLIRPQRGGFGLGSPTLRGYDKVLNSAAPIAHGNFAAGIYAGITNPASRWGGLTTPDEDLNRWPPCAEWLDRQTRKIHASFSPSLSSFYPASYQAYADLAAFGNAAAYDEIDTRERKFIDVTVSLADVVVSIDFHGRVVEVVRRLHLTAEQAAREFGKEGLPKPVQELLGQSSTERHVYYHHVSRNDDFVAHRLGTRGKRWLSRYACEVDATLIRERGYQTMPFYYPRWDVDSGQTYGHGPGMIALPASRVVNQMEEATLRASQYAADPVRLLPDRDVIPLNGEWRPGGAVYGAMLNGRKQIGKEDFTGNIGLTMQEKAAKAEEIKEAFYYSVMSLTGRTGLSDAENQVIEEARLRNWAPHADRIMEEYAARKFERRYNLLFGAGQIDPLPDGMPEGVKLQIQYTSAAAMALRASEANAVRRYIGDLLPLMEVKPDLRHRLSADDLAEVLHDASPSLPQRILVSREDAAAAAQAEQQAAQAAQMAQMTKAGGEGLNQLAQAGAVMQGGDNAT